MSSKHILDYDDKGYVLSRDGEPNAVHFTDEMRRMVNDPVRSLHLVHNHPGDSPPSVNDLVTAARSGVSQVDAIGHWGSRYSISVQGRADMVVAAYSAADAVIDQQLYVAIDAGVVSKQVAKALQDHIILVALHNAGVIDYAHTMMPSKAEMFGSYDGLIQQTASNAAKSLP